MKSRDKSRRIGGVVMPIDMVSGHTDSSAWTLEAWLHQVVHCGQGTWFFNEAVDGDKYFYIEVYPAIDWVPWGVNWIPDGRSLLITWLLGLIRRNGGRAWRLEPCQQWLGGR